MNKKTWIIVGALVVGFLSLVGISMWQLKESSDDLELREVTEIREMSQAKDVKKYNLSSIIAADELSGNLPENVEGDPKAKVIIYEYADYQCEHCAAMNPMLNQLMKDYDGKVALVFRTYILPYHANGVMSAAAANAAAIQGYWQEYKDILFANQNEWYFSNHKTLQKQLESYFEKVTDGKGDLEKFRADMKSDEVAEKLAFDMALGDKAELQWTPSIYVGKDFVSQKKNANSNEAYSQSEFSQILRKKIDQMLGK